MSISPIAPRGATVDARRTCAVSRLTEWQGR
jgi:hypothetical protein